MKNLKIEFVHPEWIADICKGGFGYELVGRTVIGFIRQRKNRWFHVQVLGLGVILKYKVK